MFAQVNFGEILVTHRTIEMEMFLRASALLSFDSDRFESINLFIITRKIVVVSCFPPLYSHSLDLLYRS